MREPHSDLPGSRLERGGVGGRAGRGQRAPRLAALAGRVARTGGEGRGAPRQRRRGDLRRPDRVLRHARGRDRGHLARDREPLVGRAGTRGHERDGRGAGAPAAIGAARGRRLQRAARCALTGFTPGGTARGALDCARGPSASAVSLEALPVDARGRDCGARRRRARLRAQRRGCVAARRARGRGWSGATSHSALELYLYTGALGAAGLVGLGPVPMGVLISRWFSERRGRAVGVAFSGMGFGVFVMGPLSQWLIAVAGWRVASAVLGLGALCVLVPIVWIGARDPVPASARAGGSSRAGELPAPAPDWTLKRAVATRTFWALWLANMCTPLAVFPVTTHQVAFAIDRGFEPMLAASVFGVMGLMSILGRAGFGLAADRFGGPLAATVSYGCTAGGSLALLALESDQRAGWLVAYALLFGLGFGARGPIITVMASDLFGGRRLGVIYGALSLGNGFGGAIGPWFGGFVHDVMGSYRLVFLASVVFCALGSTGFWLAPRRAP